MNYFSLFGLPFSYSIDLEKLSCRYQELQKQYHPDCFSNQYTIDKLAAVQHSSVANVAYQALKHPIRRAEYMLSFHGINIEDEKYTMYDTKFLMQQISFREELDCIENSEQASEELSLFSSSLSTKIKTYLQKMEKQLNNEQWIKAAGTIRKLRFFNKLQEQVEQLEEKLLNIF